MGVINHDAIVVTGFVHAEVHAARERAASLGLPVSDVVPGHVNGYASFLIAPDGSKEFWPESDDGDRQRAAWIKWAREGWEAGRYLRFVHVRYGELEAGEGETPGAEATIAESQPDGSSTR